MGTDPQIPAPVVPGRYRKKGAEVEALHWDGYPTTATVIIDWILANDGTARYHDGPSALHIDIPGGWITAVPGDWITLEQGGGFWAWDEEAFDAAHEPAASPVAAALTLPPDEFGALRDVAQQLGMLPPSPPSPEPDTAAMGSGEGNWRDQDEASSPEPHINLLEMAWGVIANAGWDDCAKTPGWQEAAVRWRDDYHRWLDLHLRPGGYQTWEQLAVGVTRERDALFAEVAQLRRDVRDFKACEPVTAIPAFVSDEAGWRERAGAAETALEHAKAALAGDNEGIRLWMLDCGELVDRARVRAEAAERKLAEAVAAERERIRQLADRTEAVCTADEGTSCYFSALLEPVTESWEQCRG
jgi:hypothetical protein